MLHFNNEKSTYSFRTTLGCITLSAKDIIYFSYSERHVYLHTVKHIFKTKIVRFKDLEDILKDPEFISIHRACIVNICHIERMNGITLVMTNGDKLAVSRHKMLEMNNYMEQFEAAYLKG